MVHTWYGTHMSVARGVHIGRVERGLCWQPTGQRHTVPLPPCTGDGAAAADHYGGRAVRRAGHAGDRVGVRVRVRVRVRGLTLARA